MSLALLLAALALLEPDPLAICLDVGAGTTPEQRDCAAAVLRESEGAMEQAFARRRDRLAAFDRDEPDLVASRGSSVGLLEAEQRGWMAYRDAHCAIHARNYWGGSMERFFALGCLIRLTRDRTTSLRRSPFEQ